MMKRRRKNVKAKKKSGRDKKAWYQHPCLYSLAIRKRTIEAISAPGETVLDPMTGMGVTPVVAISAGRNAIGVEIQHRLANAAREAIAETSKRYAGVCGTIIEGNARKISGLVAEKVDAVVIAAPWGRGVEKKDASKVNERSTRRIGFIGGVFTRPEMMGGIYGE